MRFTIIIKFQNHKLKILYDNNNLIKIEKNLSIARQRLVGRSLPETKQTKQLLERISSVTAYRMALFFLARNARSYVSSSYGFTNKKKNRFLLKRVIPVLYLG